MLKKIFKKVVDAIDDLNIIRKAFRILYYVMGVIVGILPLIGVGVLLTQMPNAHDLLSLYNTNIWTQIVLSILTTVWLVVLVFLFYASFKYWKKHGDNIVNVKNRYPNITFVADFMQTYTNSFVFFWLSNIVVIAVLAYLFMALTGEFQFYHNGRFLLYLLGVAGVIIVTAIIAVLLIMLVSFITESLKRKVQMAMDLQDIADVVRVSEITKKEEEK